MKKILLTIILAASICGLMACSAVNNENEVDTLTMGSQSYNSIATEGLGFEKPKGVEIVENPADFKPVKSNEYIFETDRQNVFPNVSAIDCIETEDSYIFMGNMYLWIFDKYTRSFNSICDDPSCTHEVDPVKLETEGVSCSAYAGNILAIEYYMGEIYAIVRGINISDGVRKDTLELYKMSLNGHNREHICTLATGIVLDPELDTNWFNLWTAVVHRGYLYYAYSYGTGATEEDYYANNSHTLFRIFLDGKQQPECICPMEYGGDVNNMNIYCQGSYVYFVKTENVDGKSGYLYRYNTEANQMEYIDIGAISWYTISGEKVIYKTDQSPKYYACNLSTFEKEEFITMDEVEGMKWGYMTAWGDYYSFLLFDYDGNRIRKVYDKNKMYVTEYDSSFIDYYEYIDGDSEFDFRLSLDATELLYLDKTELLKGNAKFVPAN